MLGFVWIFTQNCANWKFNWNELCDHLIDFQNSFLNIIFLEGQNIQTASEKQKIKKVYCICWQVTNKNCTLHSYRL